MVRERLSLLIVAGFFAIDEGGSEGPDAPIEVLVGEIVNNRGRIAVGSFVRWWAQWSWLGLQDSGP